MVQFLLQRSNLLLLRLVSLGELLESLQLLGRKLQRHGGWGECGEKEEGKEGGIWN